MRPGPVWSLCEWREGPASLLVDHPFPARLVGRSVECDAVERRADAEGQPDVAIPPARRRTPMWRAAGGRSQKNGRVSLFPGVPLVPDRPLDTVPTLRCTSR